VPQCSQRINGKAFSARLRIDCGASQCCSHDSRSDLCRAEIIGERLAFLGKNGAYEGKEGNLIDR